MTMVCCDTPSARTAPTAGEMAKTAAARLAGQINGVARRLAEQRRRRLERAALEALPFDLRKDLGWPAGDMRR